MVLHEKRRPEAESGTHQASSACDLGVSLVRIYRLLIYQQFGLTDLPQCKPGHNEQLDVTTDVNMSHARVSLSLLDRSWSGVQYDCCGFKGRMRSDQTFNCYKSRFANNHVHFYDWKFFFLLTSSMQIWSVSCRWRGMASGYKTRLWRFVCDFGEF